MRMFAYDHVGLAVADLDTQCRFYCAAFGLLEEARTEFPNAQTRTAFLSSSTGLQIELIERKGSVPHAFANAYDGAGTQGFFHWALAVDDLDSAFNDVLAAGATRVSAPADAVRPGVRFAYVKDPEGNLLEMIQTTG